MKTFLTLLTLFFSFTAFSQDVTQLDSKNGLTVSYQLQKLKEDTKKDTYLITVYLKNDNESDVFYQGPKNDVNPFMGGVSIRNADEYVYLQGEKSKLSTESGSLYYVPKKDTLKFTKEFKVPKNFSFVITSYFLQTPKQITDFR